MGCGKLAALTIQRRAILGLPMALAHGTQLGPYRIVSQVGSGGMGVVCQAHAPRLDRHVAIKRPLTTPVPDNGDRLLASIADRKRWHRVLASTLGVACLACLVVGCGAPNRLLGEADRLLKAASYPQAVAVLTQISSEQVDAYRLHSALATAHAGLGDVDTSVHHARVALGLDRKRASVELLEMAAPFFDCRPIGGGRAYYEALRGALPLTSEERDDQVWRVPYHLATLARRQGEPKLTRQGFAQAEALRRRSVILVVIDTLRADHLGLYGYGRPTSPHLDRWAAEGRVYERAYSTSSWTLPSFGSLYTGYLPMRHRAGVAARFDRRGAIRANKLDITVPTVAERLAAQDMKTGAVKNNPFLGRAYGVNRGFQEYDHEPGGLHETRRADVMVDRSLALIDQWSGDPFFLVIHLYDPHMDYDPPAGFKGKFSDAFDSQFDLPIDDLSLRHRGDTLTEQDWHFVRAAYDEEVAFVDQQLGRLHQGLAERGVLDRALVVVTADHGEELYDHGGFEHGHAMWEEIVRVPLIIWGPDVLEGRESRAVSLVDVAPTLLEWVGVPIPEDFHGQSLLPNLLTGTPVPVRILFAEGRLYGPNQRVIIQWPLKVVVGEENEPVRVTDLNTDPRERVDLLEADPQRVGGQVSELVRKLRVQRRKARRAASSDEPVKLDDKTLERLRSLGYIR